jgi:hypothetical protein
VYILVAALAILPVFGGGQADSKSALETVLSQPFGQIWLALIGFGLIGFIVWRITQATLDTDGHGQDLKGYVVRAGLLVSAATYAGLASFSVGQALHLSLGGGSSNSRQDWTAWLMQQPFGRYLVALVALVVIGAGIAQLVKGLKRGYLKYFPDHFENRGLLNAACIYGLTARGAVLLILGTFLAYAAFVVDPDQAGGTAEALYWVRQLPFGAILYLLVAAGLLAFGLYGLIEARYRIIRSPDLREPLRAARSVLR